MKASFRIATFVTLVFFLFPTIMTFCCCVNSVSMHRPLEDKVNRHAQDCPWVPRDTSSPEKGSDACQNCKPELFEKRPGFALDRSIIKSLSQEKDLDFIAHTLEGMKPLLAGAGIFFDKKSNGSYLIANPQYLEVLRI